jgi:signal transduction histidine kinase
VARTTNTALTGPPVERVVAAFYPLLVRKRGGPIVPIAAALVILAGGLALGVYGYDLLTTEYRSPWWQAVPSVAIAWTFLVAGLIAWWRRPASRLGLLLLLVAATLLIRKLQYSGDSSLFTVGFALGSLYAAFFVHVVLAYPTGRVRDRLERWFVGATYMLALLLPLAVLLVYDPRRSCVFNCSHPARVRPESLISVTSDHALFDAMHDLEQVGGYGFVGVALMLLIARRLLTATPHMRRRLAPLLIAGAAAALRSVSEAVFSFVPRSNIEALALFSVEEAVQIAVPIALLLGLLGERLARASVADLVRDLAATPPADVAVPVGRALDDPTLEVAYWMPSRRGYVDAQGRPYDLPTPDSRRAVTPLAHDGEPVAALVHDPALLDEPKLLDSVCAAARLSLENARLHAELQAQLLKVRESRTRLVSAADAERGRIERDLHDGAQQRLVALALDLRLAERGLTTADPQTRALLTAAVDSLQTAVRELRELAHGVYPAILTQSGLTAALDDLAARTPSVPVTIVDAPAARLPPDVEAAAYFVACEGLANAVKHSGANAVQIAVVTEGRTLLVTVEDDGIGGADADGSGLRGLADRVEARGGRLWIESPAGGGTRITAELPCES